MRHRYYYGGGPFSDATVHRSKDCPELETPRPLSDSTVEDINADRCPECAGDEPDDEPEGTEWTDRPAAAIEAGICPWCQEEYESVGRHASSAHPGEWERYKDD